MAVTEIHSVNQTVEKVIAYERSNKTSDSLRDGCLDFVRYDVDAKTGEVTYRTLNSTLWCANIVNPVEDFNALINTFGEREVKYGNGKTKDGKPILAWHLVQSFEGDVDPVTANQIGVRLAEEVFKYFPAVISTHTNTSNTHNHIVICAWNLDGKKYNYDHAAYDKIRECSDRLCDEYGLSVLEHTRERKLVRFKDKNGKVRYYEPTERKKNLKGD